MREGEQKESERVRENRKRGREGEQKEGERGRTEKERERETLVVPDYEADLWLPP